MLGCAKKMKQLDLLVAQGRWAMPRKNRTRWVSIYNQTLGIIGCGAIGRNGCPESQGLRLEYYRLRPLHHATHGWPKRTASTW